MGRIRNALNQFLRNKSPQHIREFIDSVVYSINKFNLQIVSIPEITANITQLEKQMKDMWALENTKQELKENLKKLNLTLQAYTFIRSHYYALNMFKEIILGRFKVAVMSIQQNQLTQLIDSYTLRLENDKHIQKIQLLCEELITIGDDVLGKKYNRTTLVTDLLQKRFGMPNISSSLKELKKVAGIDYFEFCRTSIRNLQLKAELCANMYSYFYNYDKSHDYLVASIRNGKLLLNGNYYLSIIEHINTEKDQIIGYCYENGTTSSKFRLILSLRQEAQKIFEMMEKTNLLLSQIYQYTQDSYAVHGLVPEYVASVIKEGLRTHTASGLSFLINEGAPIYTQNGRAVLIYKTRDIMQFILHSGSEFRLYGPSTGTTHNPQQRFICIKEGKLEFYGVLPTELIPFLRQTKGYQIIVRGNRNIKVPPVCIVIRSKDLNILRDQFNREGLTDKASLLVASDRFHQQRDFIEWLINSSEGRSYLMQKG